MTSVQEANRQMLKQEICTDVEFLVGELPDRKLFRAHRYVLMSRSPVFFAMLTGSMQEAQSVGPIEVPDGTPSAFGEFLRYLLILLARYNISLRSSHIDWTVKSVSYLASCYIVHVAVSIHIIHVG